MLDRLRSARPFEVLAGETVGVAVRETASKFPKELEKDEVGRRVHERIALVLQGLVEKGAEPQLLAARERSGRGGVDLYFVQLGRVVFPIEAKPERHGTTALRIFEPVSAKAFDARAAREDGLKGVYGDAADRMDRIALFRGNGPSTDYAANEGKVKKDLSYAWALWEVASSLVRQVARSKPAERVVFDPVLEIERPVERPRDAGTRAVEAILGAAGKQVAATAGPPVGHDLLGAFSWRGRAVAVTSLRGGDQPVKVWVQSQQGGEAVWLEASLPKDAKAPRRGATAALEGDVLHLFGGVNEQGDTLASHWSLDLGKCRERYAPEQWQRRRDLPDPVAWPAAVAADRETFVAGGVAKFYVEAGEKKVKLPAEVRRLVRGGDGDWRVRAAAPGDITGASTLYSGGCLFVGPGNGRDGRVYVYDNTQGGAWAVLPRLPEAVGLGQLFRRGDELVYAGGFSADGRPSRSVFALDLEQPRPQWRKLGESEYGAGMARVVESFGRQVALMVSPEGSRCFHLEAGGAR